MFQTDFSRKGKAQQLTLECRRIWLRSRELSLPSRPTPRHKPGLRRRIVDPSSLRLFPQEERNRICSRRLRLPLEQTRGQSLGQRLPRIKTQNPLLISPRHIIARSLGFLPRHNSRPILTRNPQSMVPRSAVDDHHLVAGVKSFQTPPQPKPVIMGMHQRSNESHKQEIDTRRIPQISVLSAGKDLRNCPPRPAGFPIF